MVATPRPIIMAPGVQFQEANLSAYVRRLTNTILALVGPASKGDKDKDLLITSLSNGIQMLGVPREDLPALLVLREYFAAGGGIAHFVRVANGDTAATTSVDLIDDTDQTVDVPTTGSYYNNQSLQISYGTQNSVVNSSTVDFVSGTHTYTKTMGNVPLVSGTVVLKFGTTKVGADDGNGNLVFLTGYEKYSGTVNYKTGLVTINTDSLTDAHNSVTLNIYSQYWYSFNLQILYKVLDSLGNPIHAPYVVESYTNLTLDNMATVLKNSRYLKTPITPLTAFPLAGKYDFAGGDDGIDDLEDADYIGNQLVPNSPTGLQVFTKADQIDINTLAIPGASQSLAVRQAMVQLVQVSRADTLAVLDPPPNLSVQGVADWANGDGDFSTYDNLDSTYAAIYYPWYTSYNPITARNEHTPPSGMAVAAFARSFPWQAPAGPDRGSALNMTGIDLMMNINDRAFLGANRINPISDISGHGPMVAGQYTATTEATSLDRVADRMMLMRIEKAICTLMYQFLFEPNTPATWSEAIMVVQPYLESLVKLSRIYDGVFYCDRSTNTDEVISNNTLACTVKLQLLKYAELILVTFLLTALGAQITEVVQNQNFNG